MSDLLQRLLPEGDEETSLLGGHLSDLEGHASRLIAPQTRPVDARELLEAAGHALIEELPASSAEALKDALEDLLARVPAAGRTVAFSDLVPLHLLLHAARSRLMPARQAFREEARTLLTQGVARLENLQHAAGRVEGLGKALGGLGPRFIEPSSLARLRASHGMALPAEHRESLELAVTTLDLLAGARPHDPILIHDGRQALGGLSALADDGGWHVVEHADPCAAAVDLFDPEAEKLAQMLRATRRIRLELEGRYRPEVHDPWLEQFDWQAFSRGELLLLPPVVALVGADRVARECMESLSRLLLSGRPVQVLVMTQASSNPAESDGELLSSYRFEPAYLGLCHREALVQQTSTARPDHMMRGFLRSLDATHTGLHVISSGAASVTPIDAERLETAALEARAHPLFRYDPGSGTTWADRFDVADNPQAEADWPVHELTVDQGRGEQVLPVAFTFADFALLVEPFAAHFHPVAEDVPDADLVGMAEFCAAGPDAEPAAIPFIWALDGELRPCRLAVSRPLALACRDRLDFWHTLQELAGVRSEHARRAAEEARRRAEDETRQEIDRLQASRTAELERVRRDAAREAVDRLVGALLEGD